MKKNGLLVKEVILKGKKAEKIGRVFLKGNKDACESAVIVKNEVNGGKMQKVDEIRGNDG